LTFLCLVSSKQQEASESVIVAAVITEETSNGQVDHDFVSSLQVQGYDNSGAVLLVLRIFLTGSCHHLSVNKQAGAGSQAAARRTSVAVDGEGEAVHTRAGNCEDTSVHVVTISQVDEDVFVDNKSVFTTEGAKAGHTVVIGQSDREGTAAGWRWRGKEMERL